MDLESEEGLRAGIMMPTETVRSVSAGTSNWKSGSTDTRSHRKADLAQRQLNISAFRSSEGKVEAC